MFTSGGVDMHVHLFIDHCCVNVFICVLNFRGWSQPQNHLNSIFPVYSIEYLLCLKLSWHNIHMSREGEDRGGKTEGRGGRNETEGEVSEG